MGNTSNAQDGRFLKWFNAIVAKAITFVQLTPDRGFLLSQKERSIIEVYNDCDGKVVDVFRMLRDYAETFADCLRNPQRYREDRAMLDAAATFRVMRRNLSEHRVPHRFGQKMSILDICYSALPSEMAEVALRWSFVQLEDAPYDVVLKFFDTEDTFFFAWLPYLGWDVAKILEVRQQVKGHLLIAHNVGWHSPLRVASLARYWEPWWGMGGWIAFYNRPSPKWPEGRHP